MKNSIPFLFFGFLILIQLTACSQNKEFDCQALSSQMPYIFRARQQGNMNMDSVKYDYTVLQECGNLDSIDGILFQGPILGQLLISSTNEQDIPQEITYQVLIDLISEFKADKEGIYQELRNGTIVRLEIEKTPVELSKFESMRSKLNAAGLTNEQMNSFKSFLVANDKRWNYKEAVIAFFQSQNSTTRSSKPLDFPKLESLEKLFAEAKKVNKNCLVYFSGYACVNARRFESQVLTNPEIQQLIQENFIYAVALVDDRQKAPGETQTKGEMNIQLQKQKFNSVSQPVLYLLSSDGKIISSWSYQDGENTFKSFLEKGI